MGIFQKCQFVLDLDAARVSYKLRQALKNKIIHHGGSVGYTVSKKTTHVIVDETSKGSFSHKSRKAQKLNIPLVGQSYVDSCVAETRLLNPARYLVVDSQAQAGFGLGKIIGIGHRKDRTTVIRKRPFHLDLFSVKVYPWASPNAPDFPGEGGYHLVRSVLLDSIKDEKTGKHIFYQLELHAAKKRNGRDDGQEPDSPFMFRVFAHSGDVAEMKNEESGLRECRYLKTSREAVDAYRQLYEQRIKPPLKMKRCKETVSRWIGSPTFRKTQFESMSGDKLAPEVASLVEQVWQEAIGQLTEVLDCPMEQVSLEQVERGESLLLQLRESLDKKDPAAQVAQLSREYYEQIPHKERLALKTKQDITREQAVCQLIRDVRSVSEATDWTVRGGMEAKYRTLRCHIEYLDMESVERKEIVEQIQSSIVGDKPIVVKRIFAASRYVEDSSFAHHHGNQCLLFHASKPSNFLGILSRGLLMPKIVVDDLGGTRTDAGMLGHGIYFADSASTSARYAPKSALSGTRFMTVCDVALGRCHVVDCHKPELTRPPEGFNSVQGLGASSSNRSDFIANEFTIYSVDQQRLRYLIEFSLTDDEGMKPMSFLPDNISMETDLESAVSDQQQAAPVDLTGVMSIQDPNDKVTPGLQTEGNKPIPLKKVFVRARMMDLAAQVVIFQEYDNVNRVPIEAKYVFPLEDSAAVCGFEAFIGDKHIVGKVKEKEKAHKEYREAISRGHGAYLMDEEAPDVFTVSVGNLPPKISVVIKITYVLELSVDGDKIAFGLPGSVAPWRKDAAMSQVMQGLVATLKIKDPSAIFFSLALSMEMSTVITSIESTTHPIRVKQTATKAVISLPEDCTTLKEGFQLLVGLENIHTPRMWVEQHPTDNRSQACMLTFYPEFESTSLDKPEIILLLDCSNSMKEGPLKQAKQVLLLALHHMPDECLFNVVSFGTGFEEAFPTSKPKSEATVQAATSFINQAQATQGNTDAWRPLHTYFLLRCEGLQNIFLVSDGHINNEDSTLHAVAQNSQHCRIFTFGVSASANKHLLKGMARVGCGAFEFFDTSAKSRWEKKVKAQLSKASQPSVSSLEVQWKQHDRDAPAPVQAPRQLTSLFSGSRLVVYGFMQYCTEASLQATVNGQEVSTMVSTTDLCITRGQIVHRLTARAVIRDWEEGSLDADRTHHEARKNEQKPYIIDLSKRYSIVTQLTSFVAIEERDKGEDLTKQGAVDVQKLVDKENIDFLDYMGWEKTVRQDGAEEEEVDPVKKIQTLLDQAQIESTFSVLRAEEFYRQALDHGHRELPGSTEMYLKAASLLIDHLIDVKHEPDAAQKVYRQVARANLDREKRTEPGPKELLLSMERKVPSVSLEKHMLKGSSRGILARMSRGPRILGRSLPPPALRGEVVTLAQKEVTAPPPRLPRAVPLSQEDVPPPPPPPPPGGAVPLTQRAGVRPPPPPPPGAVPLSQEDVPPPPPPRSRGALPFPQPAGAPPPLPRSGGPVPLTQQAGALPPPQGAKYPQIPHRSRIIASSNIAPRQALYGMPRASAMFKGSSVQAQSLPPPPAPKMGAPALMESVQSSMGRRLKKMGDVQGTKELAKVISFEGDGDLLALSAEEELDIPESASGDVASTYERGAVKQSGRGRLIKETEKGIFTERIKAGEEASVLVKYGDLTRPKARKSTGGQALTLKAVHEMIQSERGAGIGETEGRIIIDSIECAPHAGERPMPLFKKKAVKKAETGKSDSHRVPARSKSTTDTKMKPRSGLQMARKVPEMESRLECAFFGHRSSDDEEDDEEDEDMGFGLPEVGYTLPDDDELNSFVFCSSVGARSRSRSRERDRAGAQPPSPTIEVSLYRSVSFSVGCHPDGDILSTRHPGGTEWLLWIYAFAKGSIPETFPGWSVEQLARLRSEVNEYMSTLKPFQVPAVLTLPPGATLEGIADSLIANLDEFEVDDDDVEDMQKLCKDIKEHPLGSDDLPPDIFKILESVNLGKLFGFLKNAGIYSLGFKIYMKVINILFICALLSLASEKTMNKLLEDKPHFTYQLGHLIKDLEIARTNSWLVVARLLSRQEATM